MADITKAITAAREALAAYRRNSTRHYIDEALEDVLAALDAAQGEAVVEFMGRRRTPEKTSECWGVLLCDFMQDPPKGTKLYAAPQAPPAAVAVPVETYLDFGRYGVSGPHPIIDGKVTVPAIKLLEVIAAERHKPAPVAEDVHRNAARYLYLRNNSGDVFDGPVIQGKYIGSPRADCLTGEDADEAIDHAMLTAADKENNND